MPTKYSHLTISQREKIYLCLGKGVSINDIGKILNRYPSTISREIIRNLDEFGNYSPHRAQKRAKRERKNSRLGKLKILGSAAIHNYIVEKLEEGWSPEQIAGRIEKDKQISLVHETIYRYIYSYFGRKYNLQHFLRRHHCHRKKKGKARKSQKGAKIPHRISISRRPKSVEARKIIGHWEGDTLVGKYRRSAIATLTERKSRYLAARKLDGFKAELTSQAVTGALKVYPPKIRKTITFDNGLEFARHQNITRSINIRCFFADPYQACQRGTNENTNGLIRWYIPKGTDFKELDDKILQAVVETLNNRPRKCLGFQTPKEVFQQEVKKARCCTSG